MDDYCLDREDWDTIVELGLDDRKDEVVLKKISAATKSAFTRKYNSSDHPVAFHKAFDLGKAPKKIAAAGPAPDLEEAYEVDDEIDEAPEEKDNSDDISRDSLIKMPKKAKGAAGATSKPKAKPNGKATAKRK